MKSISNSTWSSPSNSKFVSLILLPASSPTRQCATRSHRHVARTRDLSRIPSPSRAVLITPRHGVRTRWNAAALRNYCLRHHHLVIAARATDTIKGRPLTPAELSAFKLKLTSKKDKNLLPDTIELAIGMKVTHNLDTDLDITTNGARGTITEIVISSSESPRQTNDGEILIQSPPIFVLVRLERTRARCRDLNPSNL